MDKLLLLNYDDLAYAEKQAFLSEDTDLFKTLFPQTYEFAIQKMTSAQQQPRQVARPIGIDEIYRQK